MAVDDAELLALAGGDSSDDETPQQSSIAKANSPIPSIEVTQARASSTNKTRSSPAARPRAGSSKVSKKVRKGESEEEGEASSTPGSPASLHSAAMSESDSDSSPRDDMGDEDNPYPIEGKFQSLKDKKEIMSLPEIQRESIIAERVHLLERKQQDQKLRHLLQARENAEAKSADKKRKGGTDLEESPRKSSRQKTTLGGRKVGETSNAITQYKRQREEKALRDQQRLQDPGRHNRRARSFSEGRYSSADADGESEVEWDDAKAKADDSRLRNSQPADFNDFRRTTLTRFFITEHCLYPAFEDMARGCYVRLPVKNSSAREMTYQVVPIKSVFEKEGWFYAVSKANTSKKFATNQHLMLTVEGADVEFHFNSISNSPITEVEVANYKNSVGNAGKALPLHSVLDAKVDEIKALINHRWTDEEISTRVKRSGALQARIASLDRVSINNRRRAAEERGDETAIALCDRELAELNGPKLKYGTTLEEPKAHISGPVEKTQQEKLAELNRANRKKNAEDVRKAQLAEKKAARLAREAVSRGEAVQDPFARVKTLSKTHYDVNETLAPHRAKQQANSRGNSRSGTPAGLLTPKMEAKEKPARSPERKAVSTSSGLPVLTSRNMDDEIIGSMDMGIDIEI